jgi:transcription elongation GreA/GreB family factor
MKTDKNIVIKTQLKEECIRLQKALAENAKSAMINAQETANDEKSTMEDKFESFREQMQIERDMYAKLYDEAMTTLENLEKINVNRIQDVAAAGTVVVTPEQKYFVSISLGKININGDTYMAISPQSPVFQAISGKKKGDHFTFRDKKLGILEVY